MYHKEVKIFANANFYLYNTYFYGIMKKNLEIKDIVKRLIQVKKMDVSYNKLFKLLIDRGMKKTVFAKTVGISANTLAKLSNNELVSMGVIVRICRNLNCTVDDIMDILPETVQR